MPRESVDGRPNPQPLSIPPNAGPAAFRPHYSASIPRSLEPRRKPAADTRSWDAVLTPPAQPRAPPLPETNTGEPQRPKKGIHEGTQRGWRKLERDRPRVGRGKDSHPGHSVGPKLRNRMQVLDPLQTRTRLQNESTSYAGPSRPVYPVYPAYPCSINRHGAFCKICLKSPPLATPEPGYRRRHRFSGPVTRRR